MAHIVTPWLPHHVALPNPDGLAPAALEAAAERDAPPDEILDVCCLFQHRLPRLAVNVAFFREQLA